jgi:hypothetical protein
MSIVYDGKSNVNPTAVFEEGDGLTISCDACYDEASSSWGSRAESGAGVHMSNGHRPPTDTGKESCPTPYIDNGDGNYRRLDTAEDAGSQS